MRTTLSLGEARTRRSTMLSTAMLEAAATRTRDPRPTSCSTSSTTEVVLPVPAEQGSDDLVSEQVEGRHGMAEGLREWLFVASLLTRTPHKVGCIWNEGIFCRRLS
jgi:hypothetical protein